MTHINRRRALAAVAAAPAAMAVHAVGGVERPSELAALIRRYWVEYDGFPEEAMDNPKSTYAQDTFLATERAMIGVPARTAEDALAALDHLIRESYEWVLNLGDPTKVEGWLIRALQNYIAQPRIG